MARASSIEQLPGDILEQLQALLRDPRVTQLDVTARINAALVERGEEPVSKSAVNRYSMKMEQVGKRIRQSREVADMWIGKLGAAPQGKTGQMINEILRVISFEMSDKLLDMVDRGDPDEVPAVVAMLKDLSLSTMRLEKAANDNFKRETEIRAQAKQEAAEAADAAMKATGTPKETRESIINEILGIKQ